METQPLLSSTSLLLHFVHSLFLYFLSFISDYLVYKLESQQSLNKEKVF